MMIKICVLLIVFAAVTINAAPSDFLRKTRDLSPEVKAHDIDDENVEVSDSEWQEFKIKYNKKYTDSADETRRRANYLESKKFVEAHNKKYEEGKTSFRATINWMSDFASYGKLIHGFIRLR